MSVNITVKNATKRYGQATIIPDLSVDIRNGELFTLLGPSGCGKTTLLRMIAGFNSIEGGDFLFNGKRINDLDPGKRNIGMVFQNYAIFPNMSVRKNVEFGLKQRALPKEEIIAETDKFLKLVHVDQYADRMPDKLSGGQQQRVALARALAPCPMLLLLDEPFSSLDVELRERLGLEVRDILKQQNTTALLVTHDQHEAFAIADEIGVMDQGVLQQWDSAYNLYHRPANRFVADFIGDGVLVPGTVREDGRVETELGVLSGEIPVECKAGCPVDVLLRPDDVVHDDASPMQAEIAHKAFRGADILYTLRLPSGRRILSLVPSHHNHAYGELIGIRLAVDHVVAFRRDKARE